MPTKEQIAAQIAALQAQAAALDQADQAAAKAPAPAAPAVVAVKPSPAPAPAAAQPVTADLAALIASLAAKVDSLGAQLLATQKRVVQVEEKTACQAFVEQLKAEFPDHRIEVRDENASSQYFKSSEFTAAERHHVRIETVGDFYGTAEEILAQVQALNS